MNELDLEIIELYKNGMSVAQIAVETGISPTYIRETLREAEVYEPFKNVSFRPDDGTLQKVEADTEKIYQRYRKGERLLDIAAEYGVSKATVYKYLREKGYEMRQNLNRRWGKMTISAEEFVEKWQLAQSLDDFIDATGITKAKASCRAAVYRKKGIPLKSFKSGRGNPRHNWGDLADFAEALQEDIDAD